MSLSPTRPQNISNIFSFFAQYIIHLVIVLPLVLFSVVREVEFSIVIAFKLIVLGLQYPSEKQIQSG